MTMREIITLGNSALRKKASKVTGFDKKFQKLVDDMVETMLAATGVGLAAPQVGVSQRIIVIRLPGNEESHEQYGDDAGVLHVLVNPGIVKASREQSEGLEACLSIPGYFGTVNRAENITTKGLDRNGKPIRIKARGWLARILQHEIDHLNGQLFIDIAKDVWQTKPESGQ